MNSLTYTIDVKNLNKSFNGKPAVINFSFQVKAGEICGFLGPNGSGKTTLLRMLCGLLTPDSGSGHCLGFDITRQAYEIKKQLGYMTQSFSLYQDLTAIENLDLIARVYKISQRKKKIQDILKTFNLTERKNQLVAEMSGGWKQRLALAACMLHEPKILLLDEPTAGVDPKARRDFWDNISELSHRGITTLVSTHYMDEAERCTRLAYIAYGHLLTMGTIDEIISKSKLTTWLVTGNDLMPLAQQLKHLPGVEQVSFFGNQLHISGTDEATLQKSIAPFKNSQWHRIPSGLEDTFINLVDKAKENP